MKILNYCLLILLCSSCIQSREITTQFIKTKIETHVEGNNSKIAILPLLQVKTKATSSKVSFIEICAVKYKGEKLLVIGSDAKTLGKSESNEIMLTYFKTLTVEECEKIIQKSKEIIETNKKIKTKINESNYSDYTIQKDVFISIYKKGKQKHRYYTIWINGRSHLLSERKFLYMIDKFIKY